MIFIMSAKQWDKNKKKLIIPKDYFIFDATDDDEAKLDRFTNTITMSGFNPPAKLVKLISKNEDLEDIIDIDKMEKLEDNFFNGIQFNNAVLSVGLLKTNLVPLTALSLSLILFSSPKKLTLILFGITG